MLTIWRSNRAELLAQILAEQLRLAPPGPFEPLEVVVNTWPTSRWLGEQLAIGLGGIAANLRFPFPGSHLRRLVAALLEPAAGEGGSPAEPDLGDPWRASELVWPLLERLPELLEAPEALPLRDWLRQRGHQPGAKAAALELDLPLWQLGRAIADAFDDYALYRPALLAAWRAGRSLDGLGRPLPVRQHWQPLLYRRLQERLVREPFGLRVRAAIAQLRQARPGSAIPRALEQQLPGGRLRLFGLSSMAPIQVELLQALSGWVDVELYLLTPCRDLWQRRGGPAEAQAPLGEDWLLEAPRLEARFGRLGAEFQQLLEGSGDTQLGQWQGRDLFVGPASAAAHLGRSATLLEQLQQQLVDPALAAPLVRAPADASLEFHACPGRLRQVQIVRDRLLQLLAADPSLAPRDILVMTPQVEAFAPLVAAVFGDSGATGVTLPWRLTDRSQQSEPGIAQGLLTLLALAGERLTASALEALLGCPPLLRAHGLEADDAGALSDLLQRAGFRWGLDGTSRGGDPTHSLAWALDRLLLGLVLPEQPGVAPADTAPLAMAGSLDQQLRRLELLQRLRRALARLQRPRTVEGWADLLPGLLGELFGDGGEQAWELPAILAAVADWRRIAAATPLQLGSAVVAEVLAERLAASSGRFGHRSGALTISALEPMRAIPHRVIVLMGLDAGCFPRQRERPGFHLIEAQRQLGDPSPADQDRYVLLESLLSARQHLLLCWSSRDERSGETLQPAAPVRQWLALLEQELGPEALPGLRRDHPANPLERSNFLPQPPWPPGSCDQRLLRARQLLDQGLGQPPRPLADSGPAAQAHPPLHDAAEAWQDLRTWLQEPQRIWLEQLGLRPRGGGRTIEDLEALQLDERQRAALLRQELEPLMPQTDGGPQDQPPPPPDWLERRRGQGVLPPLGAGVLEAAALDRRWSSLQELLQRLGAPRSQRLCHGDLEAELLWRGDALVLPHTAKVRCRQRLGLWLDLLIAAAAGLTVPEALLIGRRGDSFAVVERLQAPAPGQAQFLLEQLRGWRAGHRQHCWPVPPETGWAFAAAEQRQVGRGLTRAREIWEGGEGMVGEREDPVQATCFGAGLETVELLDERARGLAQELYGPLLEFHRECKP